MSLYGALSIGVSALQAQSNAINIVSDNLANATTVGYKEGSARFSDIIAQVMPYGTTSAGNSSALGYYPNGVQSSNSPLNSKQGTVTSTGSATDIAISGSGFIPVRDTANSGGGLVYTRAGSFTPDANGDLVNEAGFFLQGWPMTDGVLDPSLASGNVSSSTAIGTLQTVNIQKLDETPVATTAVMVGGNLKSSQTVFNTTASVVANLSNAETPYAGTPPYDAADPAANMASGAVTPNFVTPMTLVDSTGVSHNVNVNYLNTGVNSWAYEIVAQPPTDVSATDGQIGYGKLGFNTDGTLKSVDPSSANMSVTWTDGANPTNLVMNWGTGGVTNGITQTTATYANTSADVKGYDPADPLQNMTSGAVLPHFSYPVDVVDNTGVAHTVNINFLKTATNSWAVEVDAVPASDVTTTNGGQLASGTVTFNGDGTLASVSPELSSINAAWTNGAEPSTVAFNFGTAGPPFGTPGATVIGRSDGLSQLDTDYTDNTTANGVAPGTLKSVEIDDNGKVTATYSNNTTQSLYQIPLANFIDPNGLEAHSGEAYTETGNSGTPVFQLSGENGVGKIDSSALESSTVDIATQLTNLIVAQNAYQAGSKLISTSETMLSDLVQMGAT